MGTFYFTHRYRERRQRSQQLRGRAFRLPDEENADANVPDERQFFVYLSGFPVVQRRSIAVR